MTGKYSPRHTRTRDWAGIRMVCVAVLFALAWLVLWGRAFHVQVLQGEMLAARADRQHRAEEFVAAERGRIFDSRGRVLAKSVQCRSVYANPMDIENPAGTARSLSRIFGISAAKLEKRFHSSRPFVWIARQIADREAVQVQKLGLSGIKLVSEYKRFYPNGHLAGQLLGFTGYDGEGLEGVERSFESVLKGTGESSVVQRDARGRRLYLNGSPGDARGEDVVLTIDSDIQAMAEQSLKKAVVNYNGSNGTCIVVHVPSAEILAWAQYPFFNPNAYQSSRPSVWRNRVALDALEPGSTMKPLVVAAALQEGVVTPETSFYCEDGKFKMPGATISDTHDYGDLTVNEIVRYSSNIGSAKIGMELGAARLYAYLAKLGFGERPGLPLPGESRGIMRDPGIWSQVDLASISFGQGMSATPLQMAQAFLTLARGGVHVPLRIDQASPGGAERKVFETDVAGAVLAMMRDVVEEDGTGRRARIDGMEVAGKTGTAQKASPEGGYGDRYVASFVGLFPAEKPEFLILTVVDEPAPSHYGGTVAAPVVREVAEQALAYLGRLPEPADTVLAAVAETGGHERNIKAMGAILRERVNGGDMPDVVGLSLRRAMEILGSGGAVPEVKGDGLLVQRQQPRAGTAWPKQGKKCVLWLGS